MDIKIEQFDGCKCIIKCPDYYKEEKLSVIIFLHGVGSREVDINILDNNPYFTISLPK